MEQRCRAQELDLLWWECLNTVRSAFHYSDIDSDLGEALTITGSLQLHLNTKGENYDSLSHNSSRIHGHFSLRFSLRRRLNLDIRFYTGHIVISPIISFLFGMLLLH